MEGVYQKHSFKFILTVIRVFLESECYRFSLFLLFSAT